MYKFSQFLKSLKNTENQSLIESIQNGFKLIFEDAIPRGNEYKSMVELHNKITDGRARSDMRSKAAQQYPAFFQKDDFELFAYRNLSNDLLEIVEQLKNTDDNDNDNDKLKKSLMHKAIRLIPNSSYSMLVKAFHTVDNNNLKRRIRIKAIRNFRPQFNKKDWDVKKPMEYDEIQRKFNKALTPADKSKYHKMAQKKDEYQKEHFTKRKARTDIKLPNDYDKLVDAFHNTNDYALKKRIRTKARNFMKQFYSNDFEDTAKPKSEQYKMIVNNYNRVFDSEVKNEFKEEAKRRFKNEFDVNDFQ